MNGRDHEELLSAYHDGELAGAERASVERLLDEDVSAREALDDVADLSRLLASLPHPAAPTGLRDAVMQQVRQAAPTRAASPPPATRPRRYWIWSAATVAGLVLVVFVVQHNLIAPSATGVALREGDASPAAVAESLPAPTTAMAPSGFVPPPLSADATADGAARPMAAPRDAATRVLSPDLKTLEAAVAGGQRLQIGDVLKNIVHEGDQVQVWQYSVVDVVEAFGEAQVLLEQNGIETISGDPQLAQAAASAAETFYAIYVEAPDDKVGSSLAALRGARFVHEVAMTDIDRLSQFPLPPPKPAAQVDDERGPESATTRKGEPAAPPPPAPAASGESNAAAAPATGEGIAVPIPLPFSERDMQNVLTASGTESVRSDPATRNQTEAAPPESPARRAADRAAAAPRKRILIVLVPERPRTPVP